MGKKIDHVGIAVKELEAAGKFYGDALGLGKGDVEVVEEQKVKVLSLPLGESRVELLESIDPEGPIGKFLAKRGEGIHHIAIRVENIEEELTRLRGLGVPLIDEKPRRGSHGTRIAFLHPKGTGGVLVELCQSGS